MSRLATVLRARSRSGATWARGLSDHINGLPRQLWSLLSNRAVAALDHVPAGGLDERPERRGRVVT
eukprot:CAMPEP_0119339656 /NCGR_PEP_ID=MMETSP1333-20130426/98727_1 /TAXON_ID=418940 /ORGANISM="Scyphosphaera apsteinii, Strain RCC1455" /LENGTH=65 /DNA_ID=CAMNT_0007351225 /DNA_START=536 /DNA_END=730 /DNA_ORIENTATION=+